MMAAGQTRRAACLVIALAAASGCSDFSTVYGPTTGHDGRNSINGFGALRRTFQRAGADTHDMHRLSNRTARNDVIVWIPTALHSVRKPAIDWFQRWLRQGGRTLIYLVPDSGSETDYWRRVTPLAPPDQRLEYRRRTAHSINRALAERLTRQPARIGDWFRIEPLQHASPAAPLSGPWVDRLTGPRSDGGRAGDSGDAAAFANGPDASLTTAFRIAAANRPDTSAAGAPSSAASRSPSNPQPPPQQPRLSEVASETAHELTPLVRGRGGQWIVGQVTSPRWDDSKIIVIAGGSLLTNFAFTEPWNRQLAGHLAGVSASGESFHAGFLNTSGPNLPVSEAEPGAPRATGMELLTVWPLSLVTVHAVILGLIVCLMLLPIFGRPRRVRHRDPGRFGDHLDAVAALMNKAGGEAYARQRISEYLRRVRGETSGRWILPEAEPEPEPAAELELELEAKAAPEAAAAAEHDRTAGAAPSERPDPPARESLE